MTMMSNNYIYNTLRKMVSKMKKSTSNFIKGMGTVIQIVPKTSKSLTNFRADPLPSSPSEAIRGDWQKVGNLIRTAITRMPPSKNTNGKQTR